MVEKADVLVIGAGIAGTTLALELADAGLSVVVLERRYVGGGSSSLNAGGVRQQFALDINVRVAVETRRRIDEFAQRYGEPISSRQVGYLFTYAGDEDGGLLRNAMEVQRRWDVPTRPVTPDEIAELVPGIELDGVRGGVFCPTDGYVDPRATVTAFGRAARRAGARIIDAEVTGVETANGRVEAVTAEDRRFSADVYVNAAGAWAPTIARMYGGDLPITPMRSEIVVLDHALVGGRLTPMVLDYPLGLAFHSEGRGLLISAGTTAVRPDAPREVSPEPDRFAEVQGRIVRRLPEVTGYGMAHAWAGLIEVTPDNNPIVDRTHLDNLFTVAGFSGHGMCLAPGVARHAAALIRGETPGLPIEAYRLSRFDQGTALPVETLWSGARA
jgi:sarcosine oxidase subunit beta